MYPDEEGEVVDDAVIMSSHILRQRVTISIKNGNEKYWGHQSSTFWETMLAPYILWSSRQKDEVPAIRCWHHDVL